MGATVRSESDLSGAVQEKTIRDQLSSHLGRLLVDIASSDSSLESAEADVVQVRLLHACRTQDSR